MRALADSPDTGPVSQSGEGLRRIIDDHIVELAHQSLVRTEHDGANGASSACLRHWRDWRALPETNAQPHFHTAIIVAQRARRCSGTDRCPRRPALSSRARRIGDRPRFGSCVAGSPWFRSRFFPGGRFAAFADHDLDCCAHPRLERQIGIGRANDDVVACGVLARRGRAAYLRHFAGEGAVRQTGDREGDSVAGLDRAAFFLANIDVDAQDREIRCDEEQRRDRVRRDFLARLHVARDHCSVNRRNNIRFAEVDPGGVQRRLALRGCLLVAFLPRSRLFIGLARPVSLFGSTLAAARARSTLSFRSRASAALSSVSS